MTNEAKFEYIVTSIDSAIDAETGAPREYKPETDEILSDIRSALIEVLGLPADHHL